MKGRRSPINEGATNDMWGVPINEGECEEGPINVRVTNE